MPESLFRKVTVLYHAILLKEKSQIEVFSDKVCNIFKIAFLQNTSRRNSLEYFTNKRVEIPLKKEKK